MLQAFKQCFICNNKSLYSLGKLSFKHPGYNKKSILVQCLNCKFSFVYPFPNEAAIANIYRKTFHYQSNRIKDFLYGLFLNKKLKQDISLIKQFKNKGKALDVGAGRGDFLDLLGEKWEKWAYDPFLSEDNEKRLRLKIGNHVNDFGSLAGYPSNFFDLVILRNTIEHTLRFKDLIQKISSVLKKRGILFVRTPNTDSLDLTVFKNKWWVVNMDGHMSLFSSVSLNLLLAKYNLTGEVIRPEKSSSLLSAFRSLENSQMVSPKKLILSLIYSFISTYFGEGGDLIAVFRKK